MWLCFDLPDPTHACQTEEDCPLLCEDSGPEKAKNLCYAFSAYGDIEWWAGNNTISFSLDVGERAGTLEIFSIEDEQQRINEWMKRLHAKPWFIAQIHDMYSAVEQANDGFDTYTFSSLATIAC